MFPNCRITPTFPQIEEGLVVCRLCPSGRTMAPTIDLNVIKSHTKSDIHIMALTYHVSTEYRVILAILVKADILISNFGFALLQLIADANSVHNSTEQNNRQTKRQTERLIHGELGKM